MAMFQNISTTTVNRRDNRYPKLLKEIHAPPEVLYVKGELGHNASCLAVVGSRKPTRYGIDMTEEIVRGLAEQSDVTIVSGLAVGVDTAAHKAALKYGVRTIGVLGSGTDQKSFFPQENIHLAEKIIEAGGAVVSEYADGTPAMPHHFPERNRIIAGMSLGVIVVEAQERSGALITARIAVEENREVFAVPGPVHSLYSAGPNLLIQRGAKLITSAEDVLTELNLLEPKNNQAPQLNLNDPIEQKIMEQLDRERSVDDLCRKTNLSAADVITALSMLELKKLVKKTGADTWARKISSL